MSSRGEDAEESEEDREATEHTTGATVGYEAQLWMMTDATRDSMATIVSTTRPVPPPQDRFLAILQVIGQLQPRTSE